MTELWIMLSIPPIFFPLNPPKNDSEDLDRRTKETQRLQEEVENETKITLERFGTYSIHSSPGHSCLNLSNYCEYKQRHTAFCLSWSSQRDLKNDTLSSDY